MLDGASLPVVILVGAGGSGIAVFILSLAITWAGLENQLSYVERIGAVYAVPIVLMWGIFASSSHFTIVTGGFAVLIAIGWVVGTDYLKATRREPRPPNIE